MNYRRKDSGIKYLIKVGIFLIIGILVFLIIQWVFIPKWYYPSSILPESPTRSVTGFYEEDDDSIDVIFLGASTVLYSCSPMVIYKEYGIKSYNLATSAQPIQLSYYMLKEALETQHPKVVVLDAGTAFRGNEKPSIYSWFYAFDNMKISYNKYMMAREINKEYSDYSICELLIPIFRYHSRWTQLTERDFTDYFRNKSFYTKGYFMNTKQTAATITQEEVDDIQNKRINISKAYKDIYENGEYSSETGNDETIYSYEMVSDFDYWIKKIKEECDNNDIELMLVKIPTSYQSLGSYSVFRYNVINSYTEANGLNFIDLYYDANIQIDNETDYRDGGGHMNVRGAYKVSNYIGSILSKNYDLNNMDFDSFGDLQKYNKIESVALLETENDFISYLQKLEDEYSDCTILFAVKDDFCANLIDEEVLKLRDIGINTDFSYGFANAFVAVYDEKSIKYEALSNRRIEYNGKNKQDNTYNIISSGYLPQATVSIKINGTEYAVGGRGLNIVVLDNESNLVIDSCCIDTCSTDHTVKHKSDVDEYFRAYENYMIEGK